MWGKSSLLRGLLRVLFACNASAASVTCPNDLVSLDSQFGQLTLTRVPPVESQKVHVEVVAKQRLPLLCLNPVATSR